MTPAAVLALANEQLHVQVAPQTGASLVSCEARLGGECTHVMRPTPPEAVAAGNSSLMASFILAPWSNRIQDARFSFHGKSIQLKSNTPEGYAIHGDVRKRPWRVTAARPDSVTLTFDSRDFTDINFPWPFTVTARYALKDASFDSELTLANSGSEPMPGGLGFHPYFNRALKPGEDVELQFRVAAAYPELVPAQAAQTLRPEQDFSERRAIGTQEFDHCFAGWDGQAELRWPRSGITLRLECSPAWGHLILFAPPSKPFFALEPVTHANNGFNLFAAGHRGTGVQVLAPGEAVSASLRLTCPAES